MKTTNTTTNESNTGTIADAVYHDICDRSPRQIEAIIRNKKEAVMDVRNSIELLCRQQEIAEWINRKNAIEERARKEGKR